MAAGEDVRLERLARYATRVSLAVGAVRDRPDGRIEIDTRHFPEGIYLVRVLDHAGEVTVFKGVKVR